MSECQAVTRAGRVCGAPALRGGEFCYQHEPTRESERRSARSLGGMRRAAHNGDASSLPERVKTTEDIMRVLDYTLSELVSLTNGVQRARALINLCGEYVHCLEISEIEKRISALEAASNVNKR